MAISTNLIVLSLFLIFNPSTSVANPLGAIIKSAAAAGGRSADDATELALRSGRSIVRNTAEQAVRRDADVESAMMSLFGSSPPDVKLNALRNVDPSLMIENPQLATALGLEKVLRANPRIAEILPSRSQVELWTPESIVRHYADVASNEAAKSSPAFRLDIGAGKLTLTKPIIFRGVEYTGVQVNIYHATGALAAGCAATERCRSTVIDLGAIALLEAAAKLED